MFKRKRISLLGMFEDKKYSPDKISDILRKVGSIQAMPNTFPVVRFYAKKSDD